MLCFSPCFIIDHMLNCHKSADRFAKLSTIASKCEENIIEYSEIRFTIYFLLISQRSRQIPQVHVRTIIENNAIIFNTRNLCFWYSLCYFPIFGRILTIGAEKWPKYSLFWTKKRFYTLFVYQSNALVHDLIFGMWNGIHELISI